MFQMNLSKRLLRTPNWRLQLARDLRNRAARQPKLSEEQKSEALRHAQNLEAVHRLRGK
jgi:hypothetical protein